MSYGPKTQSFRALLLKLTLACIVAAPATNQGDRPRELALAPAGTGHTSSQGVGLATADYHPWQTNGGANGCGTVGLKVVATRLIAPVGVTCQAVASTRGGAGGFTLLGLLAAAWWL